MAESVGTTGLGTPPVVGTFLNVRKGTKFIFSDKTRRGVGVESEQP